MSTGEIGNRGGQNNKMGLTARDKRPVYYCPVLVPLYCEHKKQKETKETCTGSRGCVWRAVVLQKRVQSETRETCTGSRT